MPHNLKMPDDLDAEGQCLWHAFAETRARETVLKREFKVIKRAMRRNIRPGIEPDPAVTARYAAVREAVDEADAERWIAERAYHAYRRARDTHVVGRRRSTPPPTPEDEDSF